MADAQKSCHVDGGQKASLITDPGFFFIGPGFAEKKILSRILKP